MKSFNEEMEKLEKEVLAAWEMSGMSEEQKQERMVLMTSRMLDVLKNEIKHAGTSSQLPETTDAQGGSPLPTLRTTQSLPVDGTPPPLGPHNANEMSTPKTASKRPPLAFDSPATGGKKRRLVPSHTPRSKYVNVNSDSSKLDNIQWFYKGAPSPSSNKTMSRV